MKGALSRVRPMPMGKTKMLPFGLRDFFVAVRESGAVQVFGCRPCRDHARTHEAGVRKAPRHEIAGRGTPGGSAGAMGIWPRRTVREGAAAAGGSIGWRQHMGAGAGVNRLERDSTACAMP